MGYRVIHTEAKGIWSQDQDPPGSLSGKSLPSLAHLFHLLAIPWARIVGGCPLSPPGRASPSIWATFLAVLSCHHVLAPSQTPRAACSRSLPLSGVLPGHASTLPLGICGFSIHQHDQRSARCFVKPALSSGKATSFSTQSLGTLDASSLPSPPAANDQISPPPAPAAASHPGSSLLLFYP